nr:immunoglobulin light chain junction region [Macaca mulatta]MOY11742.1 immunoglobulin light chain junction region [Macaca mulatta]MOY11864.1 immunoglobulin light chain junction region [Macaca mulatta]MOY11980.1 immunoglobulin light chain junction region [Macaca mulatta]MOY14252.1 immunoglobulin light chain junction region [Macaca mulatta]
CQQYHDFLTF